MSLDDLATYQTASSKRPIPFYRIFVTGANGFVGRHLVDAIECRLMPGARLVLGTRMPSPPRGSVSSIHFDLLDWRSIDAAVAEVLPDLVIHLAAQSSVGQSAQSAGETWAINLSGSLALAQALANHTPEATLLFTSSAEVYGLTFNHETVTETSPLRPQSAYSRSKAAAEAMFADVLPPSARIIIVRPSNHSGPGQNEAFVIPAFAAQIARAEKADASLIRVGNLEAQRDFLDARDVVAAYFALLEEAPKLPARTVFNIASGEPIRVGAALDRLLALSHAGLKIELDPGRMRPSEVERAAIDASAIHQAVGWAPAFAIDDMLLSVLDFQRARLA